MINSRLLKSKLVAEGFLQEDLADELGISYQAMNQKINGKINWNQEQISKCIYMLKLTPDDVCNIFFAE